MTYSTSTHAPLKIPNLRPNQVLIFETPDGFRGHVGLTDDIRRITLTRVPTHRFTIYEVVATDSGTPINGTIFANEEPGSLGRNGNALPDLKGRITVTGPDEKTFEFAVWRRTAASGQPYLSGLIQPAPDNSVKETNMRGAEPVTYHGRDSVMVLHVSQPA